MTPLCEDFPFRIMWLIQAGGGRDGIGAPRVAISVHELEIMRLLRRHLLELSTENVA